MRFHRQLIGHVVAVHFTTIGVVNADTINVPGDAARGEVVANHTWDAIGCGLFQIAQTGCVDETIQPKV